MSSLAAMKAAAQSRALEDQTNSEQQRDSLVLILSHLQSHGYIETATSLLNESRSVNCLAKHDVADNIDLMQVLKESDEYYKVKFGRRPVFCRHSQNGTNSSNDEAVSRRHTRNKRRSMNSHPGRQNTRDNSTNHTVLPQLSSNHDTPNSSAAKPLRSKRTLQEKEKCESDAEQGIKGFSLSSPTRRDNETQNINMSEPRQVLKPLPDFEGDAELRMLALSIRRDIVQECPRVAWSDIVGLDDAKRLLKEAILLPRKYPQLFTGLRSPWKSALLYGMPGTGKTLLAKAVATEGSTSYFNTSASSIVSKFRGDSEKLIRMLFYLARYYAPSTIFIDEVDSIMCHRGNGSSSNQVSEHEGSRRTKTELLVQMDGLLANDGDIFVLAASNLPWDLDPAFLRRMEKRILIPLPAKECRQEMIRSHLSDFSPAFRKGELLERSASLLEGHSGSDIKALCKEVAMRPLRRILQHAEISDGYSLDHENLSVLMIRNPITPQDFHEAVATVNCSTKNEELCARHRKHRKWEDSRAC